ncbi:hypothetical protein CPB86DRAFT_730145 [Serendipita vermifera]|nr:hypothetical protein CPB86DRAFT_730145 [Serendipita vermifera]
MYHEAPRTPLRRGSQRFLAESKPFISSTNSTGSRDGGTASGLVTLEEAFQGIADEIEIFVRNMEQMEKITERLEESADIMAMFLQAQRMNTFCVEFAQAPTDFSFEQAALAAERLQSRTPPASANILDTTMEPKTPKGKDVDKTFATNSAAITPVAPSQPAAKRPAATKPGAMTNKMRKERMAAIDTVITMLPLEFRGSDPQLRKTMEAVINTLMDAKKPLKIAEIAKGPTLPQAKVNKCLIALVNAKATTKTAEQGVSHYSFAKSCLP